MTAIIATGNDHTALALKVSLENAGLQCILSSCSGKSINNSISLHHPEIAVIDVHLCDYDAIETINAAKAEGNTTIFFVLDECFNTYTMQLVTKAGAANYSVKPIDPDMIAKRVVDILNLKAPNTSDSQDYHDDMETITDMFKQLGIPAHIYGYNYLRYAIMLAISDNSVLDNITHVLYPAVSKKYNTSPSKAERAMRHAITIAWERGNLTYINDLFGYTIDYNKGKPTNSEFIAIIADKIRLSKKSTIPGPEFAL